MSNSFQRTIGVMLMTALLSSSPVVNAKRWAPESVTLERIELAPGVYAVVDTLAEEWLQEGASVATSGGFVVGEKGVLVIESFVNARLGGQMLALISEVTMKPVLYVVNTSYHGDHMYGNYLFPNATIITHEETRNYAIEHWDDDLNFMVNLFGHPEGFDDLRKNRPRTGDILINNSTQSIRIDLGNRMIEILQMGFGQTIGDLQVWLPEEKILWTGNPVVGPPPLLPWMTEGGHHKSLVTLKKIRGFLPEDAVIVPGHSVPFSVSDDNNGLDFHIAYLETLDARASEAVDANMTMTETVDHASMEEFSGYDVFNWNHKQMNVPCAYKHHMKEAGRELSESDQMMSRHCHN